MNAIGIFGGTFDPIHFGHLRLAQETLTGLKLQHIRFIPAGRPPHRGVPQVSAAARLDMVRLACAGNPAFVVDAREIERDAPSYTVDTLQSLRQELGAQQPLCLLLGADAYVNLETWHRWQDLFTLAHLVVVHRPGVGAPQPTTPLLQQEHQARLTARPEALQQSPAGHIYNQPITALDISASRIREDLAQGISPRYLVPDAVLDYMTSRKLYHA